MDASQAQTMTQAFTSAISTDGLLDGLMDCVIAGLKVALPVMIGGWGLRKGVSAFSGFLHRV